MSTFGKKLGIGIAVLALLGVGAWYLTRGTQQPTPTPTQSAQVQTVSVSIEGLYSAKSVAVSQDETVLGVLKTLNTQDPALQLVTKEYAGLGTLVAGMHGLTNGTDKKYWQYTVNGVMPQVGASDYKLKNGDRVEWTFGPSQQ